MGERFGCSRHAIPLHIEGVLPIEPQMATYQGREKPQIGIIHGIVLGM